MTRQLICSLFTLMIVSFAGVAIADDLPWARLAELTKKRGFRSTSNELAKL